MTPRAPAGVGRAGRALWRAVLAEYDLSPPELQLLTEACHTADELDRLRRLVEEANPIVDGSRGQPRANPLLAEIRRHRETLARLLAALKE